MKKFLAVILSTLIIVSAISLFGTAIAADGATATDATVTEATLTDPVKLGDVNEDGKVSVVDAKWVLQSIAGLRELTPAQQAAADTNKDGNVKVVDAKNILKNIANNGGPFLGEGDVFGDNTGAVDI